MSSSPSRIVTPLPPPAPPTEEKVRPPNDLPLREMDWLGSFLGGLRRGGVYLLGGAPGSRKSGLATQIAVDLARQKTRSLFLLTEESGERFYDRAVPLMSDWSREETLSGLFYLSCESTVPPMHQLPQFVRSEMLSPGGTWFGPKPTLVVIDSAQGHGLSSAATRDYAGLIEASQLMVKAGMAVLIINHLTKGGRLAGPAALEHAVDVAMVLKSTPIGRTLSITKNRFGSAAIADPLLMEFDDATLKLMPSKHRSSSMAVAWTYCGGFDEVVDVQARLELARYGARGKLLAPCMPWAELEQLIGVVSRIDRIDLAAGGFCIDLRVPGRRDYLPHMGLAVAIALIGAYLHLPVPKHALFIGEVDLAGGIRRLDGATLNQLCGDVQAGLGLSERRIVFCHPNTAIGFYSAEQVRICACMNLQQVIYTLWPSLR